MLVSPSIEGAGPKAGKERVCLYRSGFPAVLRVPE